MAKEDLTGDLLFSTILGYFAANAASLQIEQRTAQAAAYQKPSFGHFGVSAKVLYRYGIATQVSFPGLMMDIDYWNNAVAMMDNDNNRKIAFTRQIGTRLSAYEHLIPERFWTNAQYPGEAVSAVKAFAKAAAQGQKIYTLTSQNASAVQQIQIDETTRTEIQNALNARRTVTVHEKPISVSGWTGSGYVIEDPATEAGAYKISGGANGGGIFGQFMDKVAPWLALYGLGLGLLSLLSGVAFAPTLFFLGFLISMILAIDSLILYLMTADPSKCGDGRVAAFSVPIFLSIFGAMEFIPGKVAIRLFGAAVITDGAINNTCMP